jgi:hypothetical protein
VDIAAQRATLPRLLAENPNYFGNLADSGLPPVTGLLGDTTWEELIGVGYNADRGELAATFAIKMDSGYGGSLCSPGSWEYVRFYANTGGGWQDLGLAGVNVHDLPAGSDCTGADQLPLSYIARMPYQPERDFCVVPVLPGIRVILSWSVPPPAAAPDWVPVFGNVINNCVQIPPRPFFLADVLETLKVTPKGLPPAMTAGLHVPIPVPAPAPLPVKELATQYAAGTGAAAFTVPAHRFGAAQLIAALQAVPSQAATLAAITTWKDLGLDWPAALASLTELDGNTTYEQLDCLGLDEMLTRLVATITIKQPTGYNGGLCTAGSTEYVAFWADLGGDCTLTYLGTEQISVHDIAAIPPEGLNYAAVLPVDLSAIQQPCGEPRLIRVRAVLSWAVPPSTTDPNAVPYWGNTLAAHVQVPPTIPGTGGPNIFVIGGIGVQSIDSGYNPVNQTTAGTGLTIAGANFAYTGGLTNALPCPFGGEIVINGTPVPGGSYRVQVRDLSLGPTSPWITVLNPVTVVTFGGQTQTNVPVGEYFPYLALSQNEFQALADWYPPGASNDLWEIKLDALDASSNPLGEARYRIQLDNTPPDVAIQIDSGGDCKKFLVGEPINGTVYAVDPEGYPGSYSLWVEPTGLPGGTGSLTPVSPVIGQTGPAPGDPWSLETAGMSPCAYTLQVQAVNRVIVDSSTMGLWSPIAAVGFSLGLD